MADTTHRVIVCSQKGYGWGAIYTAHILKPLSLTTLCGRDGSRWTNKYQHFDPKNDCKRCAKKAGLK